MFIEIVDFEIFPSKTSLGNILIQYEKLMLRCELVYHAGEKKAWIRMPEIWRSSTYKHKFAYWPTKEDSDEFQKVVLEKIFSNYDLSLNSLAEIYIENVEKYKKEKTSRLN